ncbi:MAG: metallophosphoesterase [Pseudomonadota bacterium]
MRVPALAAACLLTITGAHAQDFSAPPAPAADGAVVAIWSQIVGPGPADGDPPAMELRFVVRGADEAACARYAIATEGADDGIAPSARPRANPDPAALPVTVCAAPMDGDWTAVRLVPAGAGEDAPKVMIADAMGPTAVEAAVPGPHRFGRRHTDANGDPAFHMVALGDTGCRGAPQQDCATDWKLAEIATSAAALAPDLVVHVGDYRYFEEGQSPDTWAYWLQDFLRPARGLLTDAPWLLVRGNHEKCSSGWYGVGYTYLFGPTGEDACARDGFATSHFDVAPAGAPELTHRFVLIDTANDRSPDLQGEFQAAIALTRADTWWVTHIPPVNLLRYSEHSDDKEITNTGDPGVAAALDAAIKAHGAPLCAEASPVARRCAPSVLLHGHEHLFQMIDFAPGTDPATVNADEAWPQVVIVGHGGVELYQSGLAGGSPCMSGFHLPGTGPEPIEGIVRSRSENGFVLWTRSAATRGEPSGWAMSARGADGAVWTLSDDAPDPCLPANDP